MSASIWTPGTVVSTVENPLTPIQFLKGTAALPGITFAGDVNTGVWSEADGYINFTVNGVSVLQIDSLGNVTTHYNKWVSGNEVDVASATTVDLGASTSNLIKITGTNNITSFGTTYKGPLFVRFADALILSSTATLILPSGLSIQTAAGDCCVVVPKATAGVPDGWQVISYTKASGGSIVASADATSTLRIDVASASTVDLTVTGPAETRNINITGITTINGFTIPAGGIYFVRFNAALTLTNSASLVTQRGGNITTGAGDSCILRATAVNTVEILCYSAATITSPIPTISVLTSGTTWVCPAGVFKAKLRMVGAGGGGSRYSTNPIGCGGAGGGYAEKTFATTPGASYTYAIGAAGAGATVDNTAGTAGGNTTFNTGVVTVTANGGSAGTLTIGHCTLGGTATNGDVNTRGGYGWSMAGGGYSFGGDSELGQGSIGSGSLLVGLFGYGGGGNGTPNGLNGNPGAAGVIILEY